MVSRGVDLGGGDDLNYVGDGGGSLRWGTHEEDEGDGLLWLGPIDDGLEGGVLGLLRLLVLVGGTSAADEVRGRWSQSSWRLVGDFTKATNASCFICNWGRTVTLGVVPIANCLFAVDIGD